MLIWGHLYAIEVPSEYQRFIQKNPDNTKTWWRRMGESFDWQERNRAEINVVLVIGVSRYKYLKPLKSTGNDAKEVADYLLTKQGGFEQVILLTEEDATQRAIVYFIEDYIPSLLQRHSDRSRFLFYFSGHGEKRAGIGRGYLRLAEDRNESYSGSIGMERINACANFNTRNAIHSLFLIGSCMSGIVGREAMGSFYSYRRPEELIKNKAGILITAGTVDQVGRDGPEWDGSLFNAVLLHGL